MTFSEFQQLQGLVWLNITTPTDPFVRRTYELVSKAEILDEPEKVGHISSRYRVIKYMSVDFAMSPGRTGDTVLVWPDGKKTVIEPWNVKHAKVAKRIQKNFYQHVFDVIFKLENGHIR